MWILDSFYVFYAIFFNEEIHKWYRDVEIKGQKNWKLSLVLLFALLIELPSVWIILVEMRNQGVTMSYTLGVFTTVTLMWGFHALVSLMILSTFLDSLGLSIKSGVGYLALVLLLIREFALYFMVILSKGIPSLPIDPRMKLSAELGITYVTCILYTTVVYPIFYGRINRVKIPSSINRPVIFILFLFVQFFGSVLLFFMFYIPYRFVRFLKVIFIVGNTGGGWTEFILLLLFEYIALVFPSFIKLLSSIRAQIRVNNSVKTKGL